MLWRLEQIDESIICRITDDYQNRVSIEELKDAYSLSHNEILSILNYNKISIRENDLFAYQLNDEKIIFIADTHLGSIYENIDYLNYVYEYAKSSNINSIIHLGDLMHSNKNGVNLEYSNLKSQIEYILKIYPEVPGIKTYILFGNHDFHALLHDDYYFSTFDSRPDFISLGVKNAYLNWQYSLISLGHKTPKYQLIIPNVESLIRICGHRHNFKICQNIIMAPTLSDDIKYYGDDNSYPGFLEAKLMNNELTIDLFEHKSNWQVKKNILKRGV